MALTSRFLCWHEKSVGSVGPSAAAAGVQYRFSAITNCSTLWTRNNAYCKSQWITFLKRKRWFANSLMVISADFSHKSQLCSTSYRPYLGLPALLRCDNEKEKKVLIYSEILDFQTFSCYEGNVVLSLSAINSIFHLMSLFLISPFFISIFHHFQCTFTY